LGLAGAKHKKENMKKIIFFALLIFSFNNCLTSTTQDVCLENFQHSQIPDNLQNYLNSALSQIKDANEKTCVINIINSIPTSQISENEKNKLRYKIMEAVKNLTSAAAIMGVLLAATALVASGAFSLKILSEISINIQNNQAKLSLFSWVLNFLSCLLPIASTSLAK